MSRLIAELHFRFLMASILMIGSCLYCQAAFSKKPVPNRTKSAYVSICDRLSNTLSQNLDASFLSEYWQPSGKKTVLLVSARNPQTLKTACTVSKLPFPASSVLWATFIPDELIPQLSKGLVLEGKKAASGQFQVDNAFALEADNPLAENGHRYLVPYLPFNENLLDYLTATPFGQEERTSIQKVEEGVRVDCKAGVSPAGILFHRPGKLLPEQKQLWIDLLFSGQGNFQFAMADESYKQKNDAVGLAFLDANGSLTNKLIELNHSQLDTRKWESFSLVCPKEGGRLSLQSLTLQSRQEADINRPMTRSAWIWEPKAWQESPSQVLKALGTWDIKRVYITVPVEPKFKLPVKRDALKAFIRQASKQGIQVWAVDGDRLALLPGKQTAFLNRAKAYAAYNRQVSQQEAILGIQYDIEPYLMSGYALDASSWNRRYQVFLNTVKHSAGLPIEIALPFWFHSQKIGNSLFLDEIASSVDSIAVMDYRTDYSQIVQFAAPYLKWAKQYRKKVTIALETVPLPDNNLQVYRPSSTGTVLLWQTQGKAILLLFKKPIRYSNAQHLKGSVFAYSHSVLFPSSNVTFQSNLPTLRRMLPELESRFRQWPSFAGMAIHGIRYKE